ncbi:MAG: hypothetical protein B7O98_09155 [Zestosphaera tikiterensis]|uniref:GH84 domain-containing protein n=1 Tax=Zestosphaera tikiterensis TaxID=1973259 RepID=A0A2R7Y1X8_9CREN|nr:MAG: hypothetical protein B7O98_09155 [Zestosphaera tikiterensis]
MFGVVEGFYGPYFDWMDRISLIEFLGRIQLNTYVYAPKWDPYHREWWRAPYPSEDLSRMADLIRVGRKYGVEVVFALSPGLDINYSSRDDVNLLIRKYTKVMELGVESIALLLDDIPPALRGEGFKTLAEAQSTLTNKLFSELRPKRMFLCPTYYYGIVEDYMRELGERVYPEVDIAWTGMKVAPVIISDEDLELISNVLKRKPLIWDNYPVNDYFIVNGIYRLHLGPIGGRTGNLRKLVSGYIANLANQPEASKIPLYTVADMLYEGLSYDSNTSLRNSVGYVINKNARYWFTLFLEFNKASFLNPIEETVTERNAEEALEMVKHLEETLTNRKLLKEIEPTLNKIRAIARYSKGENVNLSRRVQTAGEYIPPISPDRMVNVVFGKVVQLIPWYFKAYQ